MDREPNDFPDDLLGRAAKLLLDRPVPGGPSADVAERLVAELNQRQRAAWQRAGHDDLQNKRIFTMKALIKLALAAALALVIASFAFRAIDRRQDVAFGDVVQAVREIHSMQYKQVSIVTTPSSAPLSDTGEYLIDDAGRMRFTTEGSVLVLDPVKGKTLMLDEKHKVAFVGGLGDSPFANMNLLDRFRKLAPSGAKSIEAKFIGGINAPGYETTSDCGTMRIWVDPDTRLPLLVEINTPPLAGMSSNQITFSNFVWNVGVDESLLSIEAPAGYHVLPAMKLNFSAPINEQSVVDGLRSIAQLNGGTFPPGLDMESLRHVMRDLGQKVAKDPKLGEKMWSIGPASMLNIGRLWGFVSDPANGSDWHYAGDSVSLGQTGRPIFWYKPAGGAAYHVIDADGQVHTVSAADLPRVPSKLLVLTNSGATPSSRP